MYGNSEEMVYPMNAPVKTTKPRKKKSEDVIENEDTYLYMQSNFRPSLDFLHGLLVLFFIFYVVLSLF